ncbi:MAG TPA: class I SAM-dependent methyltransferase [Bacteroidales bacterium]|nr:class I SAM-dependent methyltransferase [Bacteroidales bacterium]
METNFNYYSKYYDLLYSTKNYNEEAKYISECINKYHPDAKKILEFGSGTGIHGLILKKMGYDIYGIERSRQMVDKAILNGYPCMQADIKDFKSENQFDVVVALFHVISYLNDNESLVATFKNASKCLKLEGLFIFDVWYSPAVYFLKPETRIKKVENEEISVIRFAEPEIHINSNVVDVNYSILVKDKTTLNWLEFEEKHPMRHFSIPEIELIAKFTGFALIKAEEFMSGKQPSENTWGVNFILKKTK